MNPWPTPDLEKDMVADAQAMHRIGSAATRSIIRDASCHILALLSRVRELEEQLQTAERELAAWEWLYGPRKVLSDT